MYAKRSYERLSKYASVKHFVLQQPKVEGRRQKERPLPLQGRRQKEREYKLGNKVLYLLKILLQTFVQNTILLPESL